MNDSQSKLIVATFEEDKLAKEVYKSLKQAKRHKEVEFEDAALVGRDDKNRLHIKETGDIQPGKGAAVGGVLGAALGLLAGPAGVVIGGSMGAMIGAAASSADTGITDYQLESIGDRLTPNTSAVVVVAGTESLEGLEKLLTSSGAEVISQDVHPALIALADQEGEG